jgi:hypothetical protein
MLERGARQRSQARKNRKPRRRTGGSGARVTRAGPGRGPAHSAPRIASAVRTTDNSTGLAPTPWDGKGAPRRRGCADCAPRTKFQLRNRASGFQRNGELTGAVFAPWPRGYA